MLRGRVPSEDDKRTFRRSLGLLHAEGLLHRIPFCDLDQERGGRTYVYGLSARGCQWAFESGENGHNAKTFDEHSQRTLDHELEISSFHFALSSFCKTSGLILYWRQRDLKCTVNPDALFAITDQTKPEGNDTLYYFLEIERAKIGNFKDGESSIVRKLAKYHAYYNSDACESEWSSFRQFRVVVVQPSDGRRQTLLKDLEEKLPYRLFWLTTRPLFEQNIAGPIFLTPRDRGGRAYSFQNAFPEVASIAS